MAEDVDVSYLTAMANKGANTPLTNIYGVTTPPIAPPAAPSVATPAPVATNTSWATSAPAPSPSPSPSPFVTGGGYAPTPAPAPAATNPYNPTYATGAQAPTTLQRQVGTTSNVSGVDNWRAGEAYSTSALPTGFNWQQYLSMNPDLGQAGLDTQAELERHYALYGNKEGRPYTSNVPKPATPAAPAPSSGSVAGTQGTFQEAYGPMYSDLLSKINAWANSPYQAYQGDRVAGANEGQLGALEAIQNAALPPEVQQALTQMMGLASQAPNNPYTAMQFSSNLPGTSAENPYAVGTVQDYMSPYISEALDPQLRELQRQSDMQRMADEARLSKAGAYGGSRQAILQGENTRNTGQLQSDVLAKGYQDAYNRAVEQQLNASKLGLEAQGLTDKSNQFAAGYGLDSLKQQLDALSNAGKFGMDIGNYDLNRGKALGDIGNLLWGIEQKGLDADYEMFKDERDSPINKLLTSIGALNSANSASRDPSANNSSSAANTLSSLSGILALLDSLGGA